MKSWLVVRALDTVTCFMISLFQLLRATRMIASNVLNKTCFGGPRRAFGDDKLMVIVSQSELPRVPPHGDILRVVSNLSDFFVARRQRHSATVGLLTAPGKQSLRIEPALTIGLNRIDGRSRHAGLPVVGPNH